jgi:hypothetical protein
MWQSWYKDKVSLAAIRILGKVVSKIFCHNLWRAVSPAVVLYTCWSTSAYITLELFASLDCNGHIPCCPGINLLQLLHLPSSLSVI